MTSTPDLPLALVEELTACLRTIFRQSSDPFCIVNWGDYYVQYLGRKEYGNLWFEAVSDYWLEPIGKPLTQEQKAALEGIEQLPLGMVTNNYSRFLPINDDADYETAARFGLGLLRDVFGWRGEELKINCPLRNKAESEEKEDDEEQNVGSSDPQPPTRGPDELPCGQILGDVSGIGPFLFIAMERPDAFFNQRRINLGRPGIYLLEHETYPNATRLAGFILPLDTCRDDALRQGLGEAAAILTERPVKHFRRERAVARLVAAGLPVMFGKNSQAAYGCLALDGLAAALPHLGGAIDHVSSVFDDPQGATRIVSTQPFPWDDYLSMLQWMYDGKTDLPWSHPSLFLVTDGVRSVRKWWRDYWITRQVITPELRLSDWFRVRDDLSDQSMTVTLSQEDHGWARLEVTLGDQGIEIDLSNVYPPFETMIEWMKRIDAEAEATAFEIEEEGPVKRLEVLTTDDSRRLLFLVSDSFLETIYIQGIVNRNQMVKSFKTAIFRFFRDEFSAERWDGDDPEPGEQMRQDILADQWFLDAH